MTDRIVIIDEQKDFDPTEYATKNNFLESNIPKVKVNVSSYIKMSANGLILMSSPQTNICDDANKDYMIEYPQYFEQQKTMVSDYLRFYDEPVIDNSFDIIEKLNKEILSFISLKNNWDGFGAYPLEISGATNALSILSLLGDKVASSIEDIFPNPHGTVTFEWDTLKGFSSLEIGINSFSYYIEINGESEYYDYMDLNSENVNLLKSNILRIL